MAVTLGELAEQVGAELHGDALCRIDNVATLQNAGKGSISFLANPRYRKHLLNTSASAVILTAEDLEACPAAALVTSNPYACYARVARLLQPLDSWKPGIHASATVSDKAEIAASAWIGPQAVIGDGVIVGENVFIGPGCVLEHDVLVGDDSRLSANITLCHAVQIGKRALFHPGVVIGSDGFGIANDEGRWVKVPQLGSVRIGDDVEIGANTTVDRGALEDTVIEDGVKLDNQIQVAHNVVIGAHTAVAGCVGIAGSARIGRHCSIGGNAGILGHLEIVDNVHITAKSLVTHSIREPGLYSSGVPLQVNRDWRRNSVRFKQLDDLARRLRRIEKALDKKS